MYPLVGLFGGGIGTWELIAIGAVALVLFGRRLPEVGRSLGKGIVEFKKGLKGIQDDLDDAGEETEENNQAPGEAASENDTAPKTSKDTNTG